MRLVLPMKKHIPYERIDPRTHTVEHIAGTGTSPAEHRKEVIRKYKAMVKSYRKKVQRQAPGHGHEVHLDKEELVIALKSGKFALISSGPNPALEEDKGLPQAEIDARDKKLRSRLEEMGYAFTPVKGKYDAPPEKTYLVMVHDAEFKDSINLGKEFKQESIVYVENGSYELHYTFGKEADEKLARVVKTFNLLPAETENYYTEYPHADGSTTKFTFPFDFGAPPVKNTWRKSLQLALEGIYKSVDPQSFMVTVMTMPARVKKIGEGRFGARQLVFDNGVRATLKTRLFSNEKFRGVPHDKFHLREAAAYQLDWKLLGFGVVPPTTLSMYKDEPASVQLWIPGVPASGVVPGVFKKDAPDWKERAALFSAKVDVDSLRKVILLDLVMNNTDRHGKNCIFDTFSNKVWAIDNGSAFGHFFSRYYNVFHKYLFRKHLILTDDERKLLESLNSAALSLVLRRYLTPQEIEETYLRARWILQQEDLGFEKLSQGADGRSDFPSYREWFDEQHENAENKVLTRVSSMGAVSA